jgi:hypothetical protein
VWSFRKYWKLLLAVSLLAISLVRTGYPADKPELQKLAESQKQLDAARAAQEALQNALKTAETESKSVREKLN